MSFMAMGAVSGLAGMGLSWDQGQKQLKAAESSARKSRAQQAQLAAKEEERYQNELTRQTEYEAREFEASTADYEKTTANLTAWKENWAAMAEDPRGEHPGWPSFETAVTEAASGEMKKVQDLYQRRGKAESGEYLRAVQDIESGRQQSLQDAMMGITREARGKMFEIDASMPNRPVLGAPQSFQQYAPANYGYTPSPIGGAGNLGELGQSLAYAFGKLAPQKKDPQVTTTLPQGQTQWAIPGMDSQYPNMAIDQSLGSQYQLLK